MKTTKKIRTLLTITLGALVFGGWAGTVRADDSDSKEVLTRLPLTQELRGKIDAVFAQYVEKISNASKAVKAAQEKQAEVMIKGIELKAQAPVDEAAVNKWNEDCKQAKQSADDAFKQSEKMVRDRDAAIREVLPPALVGKFDRGMELVHQRMDETLKAFDALLDQGLKQGVTDAGRAKDEEAGKKKISDIFDSYAKKLDAEVGKIQDQPTTKDN